VIGINTQKLVAENVSGIGFALSSSELPKVLHRFYPDTMPRLEKWSAPAGTINATVSSAQEEAYGKVEVSQPEGAIISVDYKEVGNAPAKLSLPAGSHLIVVRFPGQVDGIYRITVLKDSQVSLDPGPHPQ
jgi:S1-C subfamily serine protease